MQCVVYCSKPVQVEGYVSLEIDAFVKGPQPQTRQLVLVTPLPSFDPGTGADLGVARGVQWWYPHTSLRCKLVNLSRAPVSIQKGLGTANVYAMNTSNVDRLRLLDDSPVETSPLSGVYRRRTRRRRAPQ